jgi:hypothetical protein
VFYKAFFLDVSNPYLQLLDLPEFGARIRSPILSAISVLTKRSGLYPRSLDLQGVVQGSGPCSGGSFGDVYKGNFGCRTVAVKVMRLFSCPDISKIIKVTIFLLVLDRDLTRNLLPQDFAREGVLWRQLYHPNVLPFYGIHQCNDDRVLRLGLVSPWMDLGTIVEYLRSHPTVDRPTLVC